MTRCDVLFMLSVLSYHDQRESGSERLFFASFFRCNVLSKTE